MRAAKHRCYDNAVALERQLLPQYFELLVTQDRAILNARKVVCSVKSGLREPSTRIVDPLA